MSEQNYKIEEMEDAAVKKSNIAKTVGAAVAMGVAGAGVAYGANALADHGQEAEGSATPPQEGNLSANDLSGAADTGAQSLSMKEERTTEIHHHHYEETNPAEAEPEVEFGERIEMHDNEGNLISAAETFTVDGKDGALIDNEGDGKADAMWIDHNGNGLIDEGEVTSLEGQNVHMFNTPEESVSIIHAEDENAPADPKDDISDAHGIQNDFGREDQQFGDYADGNQDYNNHGDVGNYTASVNEDEYATSEGHSDEYATDEYATTARSEEQYYAHEDGANNDTDASGYLADNTSYHDSYDTDEHDDLTV